MVDVSTLKTGEPPPRFRFYLGAQEVAVVLVGEALDAAEGALRTLLSREAPGTVGRLMQREGEGYRTVRAYRVNRDGSLIVDPLAFEFG